MNGISSDAFFVKGKIVLRLHCSLSLSLSMIIGNVELSSSNIFWVVMMKIIDKIWNISFGTVFLLIYRPINMLINL